MRRTNQTQEDQDEYEARREASEYAAAVKGYIAGGARHAERVTQVQNNNGIRRRRLNL